MREGAAFITSPFANIRNMSYITKRLMKCSRKYEDWRTCPDTKICVKAFDARIDMGVKICPYCGASVPKKTICENCGARLILRRKCDGEDNR